MDRDTLRAVAGWAISRKGAGGDQELAMCRLADACHEAIRFAPDREVLRVTREESGEKPPSPAPRGIFYAVGQDRPDGNFEDDSVVEAAVIYRRSICSHDAIHEGRCVYCGATE